jgi:hypothetical protein
MKGDAFLVDLDRVARDPWIDPEFDIAEAFVERAMARTSPLSSSAGKSSLRIIRRARST